MLKTALRDTISLVWLTLVALTPASWALRTWEFGGSYTLGGVVILFVAIFKARIVGLYFMELRDAPSWLRGVLEFYCLAAFIVLISMYLLAR